MNCAICQRPLLEGATACVVCGAPVQASQPPRVTRPPAGPPPVAAAEPAYRASIPTAPPATHPSYGPSHPSASHPGVPFGAPQYPPTPPAPPVHYGYAPPPPPHPYGSPNGAPGAYPPGYSAGYGAPPGPAPMVPAGSATPTNGMAIASFVCGLFGLVPLWIGFVLCILAVVFGVLGIQRAGQLHGAPGKGLAIAGVVLGALFFLPASCGL